MPLTVLKAQVTLAALDEFLANTAINSILGMVYIEGGYVLILYT